MPSSGLLCLFSEFASRLSSSGDPSHDFHRNGTCAVGHLNRSCLLTYHVVASRAYFCTDTTLLALFLVIADVKVAAVIWKLALLLFLSPSVLLLLRFCISLSVCLSVGPCVYADAAYACASDRGQFGATKLHPHPLIFTHYSSSSSSRVMQPYE